MDETSDRVLCRNPEPGKQGVTMAAAKFALVRGAILEALSGGPVPLKAMTGEVTARLGPEAVARVGSVGWAMMAVKLELEVRGEIHRLPGSPQRLALTEAGMGAAG